MRTRNWLLLLAAVVGFAIWPLVLRRSMVMSVLLALLLCLYIIWSVITYLRWARTLGRDAPIDRSER